MKGTFSSDSLDQLWSRLSALYDDCAATATSEGRVNALVMIADRQIAILGIAASLQKLPAGSKE